ncbi:MAG TPA: Gfo/Idh/MocA family oxidoreductase, partial [Verrucomicrobiae bacterium]|nr:Gfo/Idh/MocA family oxidoreductase [Verrucomicrobiae bacterium]
VAVIGLGVRGREIVNTLAQMPEADIATICDTYPAYLKRCSSLAPAASQTEDYKTILDNKDIKAVIIATPTHQHKELVLAALKAGKHVYCEAPLANTIDDAKAIALAARDAKQYVFQAGLQLRSDKQRHFLLPFIRSGALGPAVMARAQFHKKQSWRATSPKPEREKELNWRLDKGLSIGLAGEIGIHAIDQAGWLLNLTPVAINGLGAISFWKDGREVPDTVQAVLEYPGGVFMSYNATLANSFDSEYEVLYGSDAAVMLRENKAWMFKEADSPLLGWEVYAHKDIFYKETGIALVANASKSVKANDTGPQSPFVNTSLFYALTNFIRNSADVTAAKDDFIANFGGDDQDALAEAAQKKFKLAVSGRPAAGYADGYQATVTAIKANEAIVQKTRLELKPEWYELG